MASVNGYHYELSFTSSAMVFQRFRSFAPWRNNPVVSHSHRHCLSEFYKAFIVSSNLPTMAAYSESLEAHTGDDAAYYTSLFMEKQKWFEEKKGKLSKKQLMLLEELSPKVRNIIIFSLYDLVYLTF